MKLPAHIGIIMDGNGRWARARGLVRTRGHLEGLQTAKKIARAASDMGIKYLTFYAFSTENWKRSEGEVNFIMGLVKQYLREEFDFYQKHRMRIRHAGDIDGLPADIAKEIGDAVENTKHFEGMQVILALNYGGRDEIVRTVRRLLAAGVSSVSEEAVSAHLDNPDVPDPDLVIRSAGEFRTSNFLLWEGAYAEYYVSKKFWPDWTEADLKAAVDDYTGRERRFGALDKKGEDAAG
ncbi:MAG: di-trans,poly-cis-decaprenylcistransferase [Treponema sp.]|jgi:undecaprenyl diphosphate synthase|nr:di-trans,poly-cis-decaprenylcistransferase [Treponema sp.]